LNKLVEESRGDLQSCLYGDFNESSIKFKEFIEQNPERAYKILNSFINELGFKVINEPGFKDYSLTQDFKHAFFLENNEFGKSIHKKVIVNYPDIEAITKIDEVGKGSNSFYVVAINEMLLQ
jgi:hypothetical protein